ncbi:MAG: hypothetical protein JWR85_4182 [Marmoricola sp.]|nr:hypothetical protein [Marmoricola sp.]
MGTFSRQIENAKKSIARKGQWVLWNKNPNGVADPATPWLPTDSASLGYVVKILFVPFHLQLADFVRAAVGSEVKSGQVKGLMASVGFTPDPQDTVNRAGVMLQIESIDTLDPNGEGVILYTIKFKG